MASVAVSNISQVNYNQSNLNWSGFNVENFRVAAGQLAGDTAVVPNSNTPSRQRTLIKSVIGVSSDLPATGATSVTVTLPMLSTAVSATIGQVDFLIVWGQ